MLDKKTIKRQTKNNKTQKIYAYIKEVKINAGGSAIGSEFNWHNTIQALKERQKKERNSARGSEFNCCKAIILVQGG